ncbi:EthD domain-containing protein [Chloroflexota bacterium]
MTIKYFAILKKRSGLTQEEFFRYWKEVHAPLAMSIIPAFKKGIQKYVQYHAISMPGFESEIDGIVELTFDDLETLQNYLAWRKTEAAKPLLEDEIKFQEKQKGKVLFWAEEHIMKSE